MLADSSITLDCGGCDEDPATGRTLTRDDGTVIPLGNPETEDE